MTNFSIRVNTTSGWFSTSVDLKINNMHNAQYSICIISVITFSFSRFAVTKDVLRHGIRVKKPVYDKTIAALV